MRLIQIVSTGHSHPRAFLCLGTFLVCLAFSLPGNFCPASESLIEKTEDYTDLWKRGEYKSALKAIDALLTGHASPGPMKWVFDRAQLRYEIGQIDEAITDLESIQERYPSPTQTLRLARMYRERGREDDFQKTLALAVGQADRLMQYNFSPDLLLARGQIAELQGHNPKAILNSLYSGLMKQWPDYAPALVASGDLAYSKWDYQLASQYYEKALKIEEDNQDALAGLAECYWKSNNPRVEELLNRLLALNPNHYRAAAIQIETALDMGFADKAMVLIERALAINPNRPSMLALKSAAGFLLDDTSVMTASRGRALGYNPHASEVYRVPGRIASRHYRFHEGVKLQRTALEVNPDDYRARAYLAFDLLRLGDEKEGRQQLEKAFEADPFNVTVFNMLNLLDTLAEFQTIERGPFVLQMPKSEAPIFAEDALALLQEVYDTHTKKYDIELAKPIRIQIFDNHDDFMVRSVGLPGSVGHLGICFGQLVTMDSPSARGKYEANWKSVLWHEFVHVITLQKSDYRMPRWLSEGVSVYEETLRDPAWGQRLSVEYKPIVDGEPLPGMAELEAYFTTPKSSVHLMFGYMAVGEFVRFYVERHGFDALNTSLEEIASGSDTIEALAKSAGRSREKLDSEFQAYFKKRLAVYDNLPSLKKPRAMQMTLMERFTTATLAIDESPTTSSSLFADAMHSAHQALQAKEYDDAEAALWKVYALFPDYAGPDAPLLQLISLYETQGRREDLIATLRKLISQDAADFTSRIKLLGLLVEDEAWPDAVQVAESALGIDPFDVDLRRSLLAAYQKTGKKEKALELLQTMSFLDPSHALDYKLKHIETLCDLGRWPLAKKETIEMLEETPHFWDAQKLLLRIAENDPKLTAEESTK